MADSKKVLKEHSEAKVKLYERYLSIYLNILSRANGINQIKLYDLFAGEGYYKNDKKGSALTALETIQRHYNINHASGLNIEYLINDPGQSKIEPEKGKIDRIKEAIDQDEIPSSLSLNYKSDFYNNIITEITDQVTRLDHNQAALLFIDPYGYKKIDFSDLKKITKSDRVEVILFLPICFMYRFVAKSLKKAFPGGESLKNLIQQIFGNNQPNIKNQIEFINSIKNELRKKQYAQYVDTFIIEKSKNQYFSLFFFTNNQLGAKAMLESKWKLDEKYGRGFRVQELNNTMDLFKGVTVDNNYMEELKEYIYTQDSVTNHQIFNFGLRRGYLAKHSNEILNIFKKSKDITVVDENGENVSYNYIGNTNKTVFFKPSQKSG